MRRVSIFGSTGSIGCNTVDLIERNQSDYEVVALSGGRNISKLAAQAKSLNAKIAVTAYDDCFDELKDALSDSDIAVAAGSTALLEMADMPSDWIMSSIVGAAGLAPGLKALEQGGTLALANKESLVTAGTLLKKTANDHGARILPVDSEHSAVFQALVGEDISAVERVIITASGGAFRDWPTERLASATPAEASLHPNWDMGQRITIDSATLFNKAMELIETHEFFDIEPSCIEAVIHPESLIHALVGFTDGALMAHVGPPDMRHAIGYALHWPDRKALPVERLNLVEIGKFTFLEADEGRYPALSQARWVMEEGGLAGAVFNAAKETALDGFIAGKIGFLDMASVVADVIEIMSGEGLGLASITLDTVQEADRSARRYASESVQERQRR